MKLLAPSTPRSTRFLPILPALLLLGLAGCAASTEPSVEALQTDESAEVSSAPTSESDCQDDWEENTEDPFAYRDGGVPGDSFSCEFARGYAELGLNTPKTDPDFHLLYGDIVTPEMEAEYRQWMDILVESLGGYDRWVHAVYEEGSTDDENRKVLDGLAELGYFERGTPSIEEVFDRRSCLSGFFTEAGHYSMCNQPEHWTDSAREFHRNMMGELYFSYEILHEFAHEYHHHVQKAHSLGKMEVSNGPGDPIPPDGFAPTWYIEGSAGISPSWIIRDNFDELALTKRLGVTYGEISDTDLGTLLEPDCDRDSVEYFQSMEPGPSGQRITFAQEFYEGQQEAYLGYVEPNSAMECMNLYLMHRISPRTYFVSLLEDNWELGWHGSFLKHTGVTMDEFYAEFEAEMMSISTNSPDSFPEWTSGLPETSFVETVDYWSISSGPLNEG